MTENVPAGTGVDPATQSGANAAPNGAAAAPGATPAAGANPPAAGTVVNTAVANTPANFPDTWRQLLASGDAKEAERLGRFADPTAVWKAYRELETKISSGAVKQPLPANPTPEQVAAYRKENGIPEKATDYELQLSEGLVIGEQDEATVGHLLQVMHNNNMAPSVVSQLVDEYFKARQDQAAERDEQQRMVKFKSEEALRAKWGNDYVSNAMAVKNLLAGAGELGDQLLIARLPDGSMLGNNQAALEWLAGLALELNPAGTVVPGGTANQAVAIEQELDKLNAMMTKNIAGWHAPSNAANKARHRELIDAQQKIKARGY